MSCMRALCDKNFIYVVQFNIRSAKTCDCALKTGENNYNSFKMCLKCVIHVFFETSDQINIAGDTYALNDHFNREDTAKILRTY